MWEILRQPLHCIAGYVRSRILCAHKRVCIGYMQNATNAILDMDLRMAGFVVFKAWGGWCPRTNPLGIPKDNYISLFTMYDNLKNTL